jgi:hypothetical protein
MADLRLKQWKPLIGAKLFWVDALLCLTNQTGNALLAAINGLMQMTLLESGETRFSTS